MNAKQRTLRARTAAHARWDRPGADPKKTMKKVRHARTLKLRAQVLVEAEERGEAITPEEINRRAESRRKAQDFSNLLKAQQART